MEEPTRKYCITWNSRTLISTKTWTASTIGEAIDRVFDAEFGKWGGIPTFLEILMLGERCQKSGKGNSTTR